MCISEDSRLNQFVYLCSFTEARMNKIQEGLAQQRKLVEQLRLEAAVPRVRVSECIEDIMRYCEQHTSEDVLINGFLKPGDNPYKEKGGCTILWNSPRFMLIYIYNYCIMEVFISC